MFEYNWKKKWYKCTNDANQWSQWSSCTSSQTSCFVVVIFIRINKRLLKISKLLFSNSNMRSLNFKALKNSLYLQVEKMHTISRHLYSICRKNSVKLTFAWETIPSLNWFDEKTFAWWREFLVFPHHSAVWKFRKISLSIRSSPDSGENEKFTLT